MAHYEITYSCGCIKEKQLYGKAEDRQRYIAWARREGICPDCTAVDADKARDAFEAERELPPLAGTDKQIAWARQLRAKKLDEIETWLEAMRQKVPADKIDVYEEQRAATMQVLFAEVRAAWWIDRQHSNAQDMASEAYRRRAA